MNFNDDDSKARNNQTGGTYEITPDDKELFHRISTHIRQYPYEYQEATDRIDNYCSPESYWKRQQEELKALLIIRNARPLLDHQKKDFRRLRSELKERPEKSIFWRATGLVDHIMDRYGHNESFPEEYEDRKFIPVKDGKLILLTTWLLTDPDTDTCKFPIPELGTLPWETEKEFPLESRYYLSTFFTRRSDFKSWIDLVRNAWRKVQEEHTPQHSTTPTPVDCESEKNTDMAGVQMDENHSEFKNKLPVNTHDNLASAEEPLQSQQTKSTTRITKEEANIRCREILGKKSEEELQKLNDRKIAALVGCSTGLATNLPVWKSVKERLGKNRSKIKHKTVALTDNLQKIVGTGERDETLKRLIAEQEMEDDRDEKQAILFKNRSSKSR